MNDVLQSSYYKSPLDYDNIDWFVNEIRNLDNKRAFYFKKTKKDINMTEEDKEVFENNNTCQFFEKIIESDKNTDHCHSTGKFRGPAHNICNTLRRNKVILYQMIFTISVFMIVIYFFKELVDVKMIK